jgi:sensor histidine kinase regulating citrate/malate metabolism
VTGRSVAGQVFLLQVVIVLLLVVSAVVAQVLQVRHDTDVEAGNRSLAVAQTFANAPGTAEALRSPDPTAVLQPRAEAARLATGVDFVVVMNTQRIRYTHPKTDRIGKKFVGTIAPALAGRTVTEHITGTIGPLVQVVVPVRDPAGKVVGLVSAGITTAHVGGTADQQLPLLLGAAAAALALATAGTALVSRRLLRQTHGLGPYEMTRMYEHHDAVLHAVREGVLIVGGDGRLLLANDEAHRLLDLPADAERRHVLELGLDDESPRTRCTWSRTACWRSTSGPRICAAGRPAASPRCATPPSCGPCRAGRRWPGSGWTCSTTPGWASVPAWT